MAQTSGKLQITTPNDREVVMTRVFDAPRALVFEALTKPELLKRWMYGFDGWELATCEIDLRVGGAYRYVWKCGEQEMGMRGVFEEVEPPARLVATEVFDEAWYPGEALDTTVLVEKDGRTTLTLTVRYESREARDMALKTGMADGLELGYSRLDGMFASSAATTRK